MSSRSAKKASLERFEVDLANVFSENRMVVFLCGPALSKNSAGARLRGHLKEVLEQDEFEVVLGEDDGLKDLQEKFAGVYAHENEVEFIRSECGAIVLVADSPGSFCELGLFAYLHSHEDTNRRDFILLVDKCYQNDNSYLNEGPAKAIGDFGVLYYEDFEKLDSSAILKRLRGRRAVYFLDGRGRPAKNPS